MNAHPYKYLQITLEPPHEQIILFHYMTSDIHELSYGPYLQTTTYVITANLRVGQVSFMSMAFSPWNSAWHVVDDQSVLDGLDKCMHVHIHI